jgi:hypothetical protein
MVKLPPKKRNGAHCPCRRLVRFGRFCKVCRLRIRLEARFRAVSNGQLGKKRDVEF